MYHQGLQLQQVDLFQSSICQLKNKQDNSFISLRMNLFNIENLSQGIICLYHFSFG